jgi:hypothetical protein
MPARGQRGRPSLKDRWNRRLGSHFISEFQKFRLTPRPNHFYTHAVLPTEGCFANVTNAGQCALYLEGQRFRQTSRKNMRRDREPMTAGPG